MARINTSFGGGQADAPPANDASPAPAPIRKRGRKAKAEAAELADEALPSKRARKTTEVGTEPRRSRRDRGSGDGSSRQEAEGKRERREEPSPASAKNSKTRPEKARKTAKAARSSNPPPEGEPPKRKAGRPRKSDASAPDVSAEEPAADAEPSDKARARSRKAAKSEKTIETATAVEAESPRPKSKGKRQAKPSQQTAEREEIVDAEEEVEAEPEPETEAEEEAEDARHRRRQSSGPSAGQADASFRLRQLVPRTRLIPMATMANKWAPLEKEAIAAVHALLEECARPVIARVRIAAGGGGGAAIERRQEQTRQAISSVTRRLRSKLVKGIPFPPGTVVVSSRRGRRSSKGPNDKVSSGIEADFNYESAVEGAQALEQQLNPLQHAVALLERERKREEAALEADYATLRELETNAQVDLRTWRERARKAHVLAPVDGGTGNSSDPSSRHLLQVELVARAPASDENNEKDQQSGGPFEYLSKDLSTTTAQLSSHMESMKTNLQQIDAVMPAIIQSKAALQHVLHERLDPLQYERILLGQ